MPDTNIIISAILRPDSKLAEVLLDIGSKYEMVLSAYIIDETKRVLGSKYPGALPVVQKMLGSMQYELVPEAARSEVTIADPKDQPILDAAIVASVDIIVSGDKHFKNLDIERPKVMSPAEFLALSAAQG
ncbi:MAG: PIN domain-containing protein [Coriobacteriia bacterium]|nr:PIN domain-containing protein [Coriobacteriia bacterium]